LPTVTRMFISFASELRKL